MAEVATEKAGIVKEGGIAVGPGAAARGPRGDRAAVAEVGAELKLEDGDFEVEERLRAVGGQALRLRGAHGTYDDLFLPLFGENAARNAAAAVAAVEALLGRRSTRRRSARRWRRVRSPGRLEIVARHPAVILDGAHNPAGAEALAATLREAFTWERLHLVISISANKDVSGIIRPLGITGRRRLRGTERQRAVRDALASPRTSARSTCRS